MPATKLPVKPIAEALHVALGTDCGGEINQMARVPRRVVDRRTERRQEGQLMMLGLVVSALEFREKQFAVAFHLRPQPRDIQKCAAAVQE